MLVISNDRYFVQGVTEAFKMSKSCEPLIIIDAGIKYAWVMHQSMLFSSDFTCPFTSMIGSNAYKFEKNISLRRFISQLTGIKDLNAAPSYSRVKMSLTETMIFSILCCGGGTNTLRAETGLNISTVSTYRKKVLKKMKFTRSVHVREAWSAWNAAWPELIALKKILLTDTVDK
ncbi:hypothetical protein OVA10_23350 [Lelliottia sp. SL45]|uniref:hypothetical protein n=1 Tax=Lelliottia sp. SL45 TaxID=2994665 RepID=UPI002276C1CB|nr:hypothetical protein [Lelliottia sp. SL45]MCY1700953.1 hypothetical protein [Lelliottia sp. SL45]